jgi:hypothetical protein
VTVPVARASARRTVRVAAALVAGQAVLCAVIGYVTLGGPATRDTNAARTGDPLAARPFARPAPAVSPPSPTTVAPEQSAVAKSTAARPAAPARPRHPPKLTPTPPTAESPPDVLVAPPGPPTGPTTIPTPGPPTTSSPDAPSSTGQSGQPPPPPASLPTQESVTVGESCAPVDASGVTTDGIVAQCVSSDDGVLRWQQA